MNTKVIRKALYNAFGSRKYRITASGEIHVFGIMPNTDKANWYLFGWIGNTETENHIKCL
jgi:hypothetical protein